MPIFLRIICFSNLLNSLKLKFIIYLVPVEPKPPEPRFVSSSVFTSFKLALIIGHKTIWAIRAPFSTKKLLAPKLIKITFNSPL